MVVCRDNGGIKPDARPDGAQAIVEHLIFERKIPVRESARSPKDLSPVRRVVWREIRRIYGPTARQEFPEFAEIPCPSRRVRLADWTNSSANSIVNAVLEHCAQRTQPVRFGFAV